MRPKLGEGGIKADIPEYSSFAEQFEMSGFHFSAVYKKHWHP